MANTKISNLTGAASVTDNSVFPVVDSGSTKKVTGTQIRTYARSGLSTVAVSGSYTDLTNKPTIFDGNYNNLTNKPTLFDGSYTSLTSKPTLFDGNYTSLTNKPTLFDGSYNSLTDTPTIFDGNYDGLTNKPIISDTNGLTGGTFFIAKDSTTIQLGQWAAQAITIGSSGIQIAGTGGVEIAGVAGAGITLGGETSGTITFTSATSGINYDDLTNKPTIPTTLSQLTNDSGFITSADIPSVPTTTSQLTNDSGFITLADVTGGGGVTSYNDLTDKPSIPSSLSDLGITAGSDGQVLKLNSSLTPVWSNPVTTGNFTFSGSTLTSPTDGVIVIPNTDEYAGIRSTNDRGRMWFDSANTFHLVVDNTYQHNFNADGSISFGGGYTFPNTKGTAGQVLVSDVSGVLTWQDQASGGGGGGNPFDQDLNTTNSPTFGGLSLGSGGVSLVNGADVYTGNGGSIDLYTDWETGQGVEVNLQHNDRVTIGTNSGAQQWSFKNDGALSMPSAGNGTAYQLSPSVAQTVSSGAAPTVVYTSSGQFVTGIKAVISVMTTGDLIGGTQITDTQISEMLVTIRYTNVDSVVTKTAVGSVYGVTHTSASPLATFTVNVLNDNLQILAEPTNLVVGGMTVQVVATELLGTP